MGLVDITEDVETIAELDDERQGTFRDEYKMMESGETDDFSETRAVIAREREALNDLGELLADERENLDELIKETEFFTVNQAIRHRDAVVEKLEAHNECLETFRTSVERALDTMESNLDVIVKDGPTEDIEDVERHLEAAYRAIEEHNEVVEDLNRNLIIMSAYLP